MKKLGCHLSEKDGFMNMAHETIALNGNTFQFFTRNPRGGHTREWAQADIDAYKAFAQENGIGPIVAYAPYTVNPAAEDMKEQDFARMVFSEDLTRLEQIPGQYYAAHPGSATDSNETQTMGMKELIEVLNTVITPESPTTFLVINGAAKGNEIASKFEDLGSIIKSVNYGDKVGVLFDICDAWAAGYDVKDHLDDVLEEFDKQIGLAKMKAIHLADPKFTLGDHSDHHAPLGEGQLGQEAINAVFMHPELADKVFILETPHDDMTVFKNEMSLLRNL